MRLRIIALAALVLVAGCSTQDSPRVVDKAEVGATTTTLAETTTTTAPVTTTSSLTPEDLTEIERVSFELIFEQNRVKAATAFEDDPSIQSVDRFVYDPATETVVLEVTSSYLTQEYQEDQAWETTKAFATELYTDDVWVQDHFVPNFSMIVSGTAHTCSADFMLQLADYTASRSDWDVAC